MTMNATGKEEAGMLEWLKSLVNTVEIQNRVGLSNAEIKLLQKDFAKLLSVAVQTIRNWERDRFLPKKESVAKIAKFFQIEEKFLLTLY